MKERYIVEHQFISDKNSQSICTSEHGVTYKTREEAAARQREYMRRDDDAGTHPCVGFRVIKLVEQPLESDYARNANGQ